MLDMYMYSRGNMLDDMRRLFRVHNRLKLKLRLPMIPHEHIVQHTHTQSTGITHALYFRIAFYVQRAAQVVCIPVCSGMLIRYDAMWCNAMSSGVG